MEGGRMRLVHLTSSIFYGGPDPQTLGMADAWQPGHDVLFISFAEAGRCQPFLTEARRRGYDAIRLTFDTPRLLAAARELSARLREIRPDVVFCHTYKANLVGRPVCRTLGVRVVAVSRAWTGEAFKVRMYDRLARFLLKRFAPVVAGSHGEPGAERGGGSARAEDPGHPQFGAARRFRAAGFGGASRSGSARSHTRGADRCLRRPAQPRQGVRRVDSGSGRRVYRRSGRAVRCLR